MSHHHRTGHFVLAMVLGALATQFPRTAGFIVLTLFGLGSIIFLWVAFLVVTERL